MMTNHVVLSLVALAHRGRLDDAARLHRRMADTLKGEDRATADAVFTAVELERLRLACARRDLVAASRHYRTVCKVAPDDEAVERADRFYAALLAQDSPVHESAPRNSLGQPLISGNL